MAPVGNDLDASVVPGHYRAETPGSSRNDFSTASRSNPGFRSPGLARSIIRLAISVAVGWVRSCTPIACNVSSNAQVMTVISSGLKTSSRNSSRIGTNQPRKPPRKVPYHVQAPVAPGHCSGGQKIRNEDNARRPIRGPPRMRTAPASARTLWNFARSHDQIGLMPAALITFAHFSVSSAMNLPNSVGDVA